MCLGHRYLKVFRAPTSCTERKFLKNKQKDADSAIRNWKQDRLISSCNVLRA